MTMDWGGIATVITATAAVIGPIGVIAGQALSHKKSREESVDGRFERLIVILQGQVQKTAERLNTQDLTIATLHAELASEREELKELERKYETERKECEERVGQLEADYLEISTFATMHGWEKPK